MGSTSASCVLTVEYSPDSTNWYTSSNVVTAPLSSTFALDFNTAAGYIRLSATSITLTSTISAFINHV